MTTLTPIYDQVTSTLGFTLQDIIDDRTGSENARITPQRPTKRQRHKENRRVNRLLSEVQTKQEPPTGRVTVE
jgi:hypothetical protein